MARVHPYRCPNKLDGAFCRKNRQLEHLARMGLGAVPPEIGLLTNLNRLFITGGSITTLPPEIGQLKKLWNLRLQNNHLDSLPAEFGNLDSLLQLNISRNKFTSLPDPIKQLKNLQTLICDDTLLDDENGIYEMPWLMELIIYTSYGGTYKIPTFIEKMTGLDSLIMCDAESVLISDAIGRLDNLTNLCLEGNNLDVFPPVTTLVNLEQLKLSRNNIASIPAEIKNMTSLGELDMEHNALTTLPPEIGLTNLEQLCVAFNHITRLPSEIGNLHRLQELNIASNPISRLPDEISDLVDISSIQMWDTNISVLPCEIHRLRFASDIIPAPHRARAEGVFNEWGAEIDLHAIYALRVLSNAHRVHLEVNKIWQQRKRRRTLGQLQVEATLLRC